MISLVCWNWLVRFVVMADCQWSVNGDWSVLARFHLYIRGFIIIYSKKATPLAGVFCRTLSAKCTVSLWFPSSTHVCLWLAFACLMTALYCIWLCPSNKSLPQVNMSKTNSNKHCIQHLAFSVPHSLFGILQITRAATVFHKQANPFELSLKSGRQNQLHNWLICSEPPLCIWASS